MSFRDVEDAVALCKAGLTEDEVVCWRRLRRVESDTYWGHSIGLLRTTTDAIAIKQLLKEMASQARDNKDVMIDIVGVNNYRLLIKLGS